MAPPDDNDIIRVDDRRDCCGVPIWWKHEQWRKQHEKFVASLTPEQRELWYMRGAPPGLQ